VQEFLYGPFVDAPTEYAVSRGCTVHTTSCFNQSCCPRGLALWSGAAVWYQRNNAK